MASLRDLLFGAGVLKKVATADPAAPAPQVLTPAQPSGIDVAAEAQKAAARAKATAATPATATPAPAAPLKPRTTAAGTIGAALKGAQ